MLPSELYRTSVKQVCVQYSASEGVDADLDFFNYIDYHYTQIKRELSEVSPENKTEQVGIQNELFVFAVGIFAYGKIDAAKDILNSIPSSGNVRRLALALKALLPLPDNLDPLKNAESVILWLETNCKHMKWNESQGIYEDIRIKQV